MPLRTTVKLPDRILSLLRASGGMPVEVIAAELCAPGSDACSRVWSSLHGLQQRGLVIRDGDLWRRSAG
jgi:hypothetical protein